MMHPLLKGVLIGVLPAIVVDFRSFSSARSKDRSVSFDWALALSNWASGALLGLGGAAGIDAAGG